MNINLKYVPRSKQQKREYKVEDLCIAIKNNGERCKFVKLKGTVYCGHHKPKEDVSNKQLMTDSYTNTEGTIIDITTANKLILEFIDDKVEYERSIAELLELNNILRTELNSISP